MGAEPSAVFDFAGAQTIDPVRGGGSTTFTRADTALASTYWGADGLLKYAAHNTCLQSQTFDNASWTKNRVTVSANATTAPDGTTTADKLVEDGTAANTHFAQQGSIVVALGVNTFSVYAKAGERTKLRVRMGSGNPNFYADFNLTDGTVTGTGAGGTGSVYSSSIQSAGGGWYRCSVSGYRGDSTLLNAALCYLLDDGGNTSYNGDGASGLYLWGGQVNANTLTEYVPTTTAAVYAANDPRFDHNPSTGESLGLLIEGSRANLCLQSNGFDTTWTNTNSVDASAQGTSPDGTNNAWRITDDSATGTGAVKLLQSITLTNAAYTFSVFAKADQLSWLALQSSSFTTNGASYFDLANGVVGTLGHTSSGIQSVGNGWYRCWVVFTPGADAAGFVNICVSDSDGNLTIDRDGTSSILIYGAQVELGSFPSSYIPTTTASVTRAADVCTYTGLDTAPWYNASQGTWLIDGRTGEAGASVDQTFLEVRTDGNNRAFFRKSLTGGNALYQGINGGATQWAATGTGPGNGADIKYAGAYKANDVGFYFDGAVVGTDAAATIPAVTTLTLGSENSGVSRHIFGHISRISYWNRRLPNDALVSLSA